MWGLVNYINTVPYTPILATSGTRELTSRRVPRTKSCTRARRRRVQRRTSCCSRVPCRSSLQSPWRCRGCWGSGKSPCSTASWARHARKSRRRTSRTRPGLRSSRLSSKCWSRSKSAGRRLAPKKPCFDEVKLGAPYTGKSWRRFRIENDFFWTYRASSDAEHEEEVGNLEERHNVPISVTQRADDEWHVTDRQRQVVHALPLFETLLFGAATWLGHARPHLVAALAVQNVAQHAAQNDAPKDDLTKLGNNCWSVTELFLWHVSTKHSKNRFFEFP